MRTLTGALQAAIAAPGGYSPDVKLELADSNPHFASVTSPGQNGPCAAVIAPDSSVAYRNVTLT